MYYLQQFGDGIAPVYAATARVQTTIPLCRELFGDELRTGISIMGCRNFVSYKDAGKLDAFVIYPLTSLLELFYGADPENARLAAEDMIDILAELDTDDDTFPNYEIAAIRDAVKLPSETKDEVPEGLAQFLKEELICSWKGFAVWNDGNGTVDCHYEAKIVLSPTETVPDESEFSMLLMKNPLMKKEKISEHFEKRLRDYLDEEFEEYCTEEDYYQPVVEDFELEYHVKAWCRETGFELKSWEGGGDDDGYEPKNCRS